MTPLNVCASSATRGSARWREDAGSNKTPAVAAIAQETNSDKKKEDERKTVPESFHKNRPAETAITPGHY
jgi:hypothetical protein